MDLVSVKNAKENLILKFPLNQQQQNLNNSEQKKREQRTKENNKNS